MANQLHACITKQDPCRLDVIRRTTIHVLSTYQNERLNKQEEWIKHTLHSISLSYTCIIKTEEGGGIKIFLEKAGVPVGIP